MTGRFYEDWEDAIISVAIRRGRPMSEVAKQIGRSVQSIRQRARDQLGLPVKEHRPRGEYKQEPLEITLEADDDDHVEQLVRAGAFPRIIDFGPKARIIYPDARSLQVA